MNEPNAVTFTAAAAAAKPIRDRAAAAADARLKSLLTTCIDSLCNTRVGGWSCMAPPPPRHHQGVEYQSIINSSSRLLCVKMRRLLPFKCQKLFLSCRQLNDG